MPAQHSATKSDFGWLDLNLPLPDAPLPPFPQLPLETVYALNEELWEETKYDDAYFAHSLARKNPEPFVL